MYRLAAGTGQWGVARVASKRLVAVVVDLAGFDGEDGPRGDRGVEAASRKLVVGVRYTTQSCFSYSAETRMRPGTAEGLRTS